MKERKKKRLAPRNYSGVQTKHFDIRVTVITTSQQ